MLKWLRGRERRKRNQRLKLLADQRQEWIDEGKRQAHTEYTEVLAKARTQWQCETQNMVILLQEHMRQRDKKDDPRFPSWAVAGPLLRTALRPCDHSEKVERLYNMLCKFYISTPEDPQDLIRCLQGTINKLRSQETLEHIVTE